MQLAAIVIGGALAGAVMLATMWQARGKILGALRYKGD